MVREDNTLEIENARLRVANQALRDALAFTGHELRNRITSLRMGSEKIMRIGGALSPDLRSALQIMHQDTEQITHIVHNYLSLARVETPSLHLERLLIDPIWDVIRPAVCRHADLLTERGQICEVHESTPGLLVWADRNLLTTVFDNLISNAIKYGEQSGTIIINVIERDIEDEFGIWNSGEGVDRDRLDQLFMQFSPDLQYRGDHTGIGLYLTRRIVEAHGGRIWADSQPGEWIKMTFTFPKRAFPRRFGDVSHTYCRR